MLRFKIRDLLWLTVVVALVTGWLIEGRTRRQLQAKQQKLDMDISVKSRQVVVFQELVRDHFVESRRLEAENFKLQIALVEARARIQVEDVMAKARARASRPSSP